MRERWREMGVENGMKTIIAAAALLAASPAGASTLVLFDVDAAYGGRLALTPLLEQDFARQMRAGTATPIIVPVNDDGSPRTTVVDVSAPVPVIPTGAGRNVLRGRVTWQFTTSLSGNVLSYEAVMTRVSVFTDGVNISTPNSAQTSIIGTGSTDRPGPIIARRYAAPGGERMVIGFLKP